MAFRPESSPYSPNIDSIVDDINASASNGGSSRGEPRGRSADNLADSPSSAVDAASDRATGAGLGVGSASHRADRRRTHRRTREASCRLGHAMTAPRIRTLMTTRSQVRESPRHPQTSSRSSDATNASYAFAAFFSSPSRESPGGSSKTPRSPPERRREASIVHPHRTPRHAAAAGAWGFVVASGGGVSSRRGLSSASSLAALFVDSGSASTMDGFESSSSGRASPAVLPTASCLATRAWNLRTKSSAPGSVSTESPSVLGARLDLRLGRKLPVSDRPRRIRARDRRSASTRPRPEELPSAEDTSARSASDDAGANRDNRAPLAFEAKPIVRPRNGVYRPRTRARVVGDRGDGRRGCRVPPSRSHRRGVRRRELLRSPCVTSALAARRAAIFSRS